MFPFQISRQLEVLPLLYDTDPLQILQILLVLSVSRTPLSDVI